MFTPFFKTSFTEKALRGAGGAFSIIMAPFVL